MKSSTMWTLVAATALSAGIAGAFEQTAGGRSADTVATVAGEAITSAQVEAEAGGQLAAIRNQEYETKRRVVDSIIAKKLLAAEAKARGISQEDLEKQEIDAKAGTVSDEEIKAQYEQVKARIPPNITEADALKRIGDSMRQQKVQARRTEFIKQLRDKSSVKVMLDPPRIAVQPGDGPAKGPKTAPVTIVEFSDFQCPFCSRVVPTLKKVEETYGDKVRVVFRDFPLPMHPNAPKAAEAGVCANEQGKFWEMHDAMFANQNSLQPDDLKKKAAELGMNAEKFGQCLDSGKAQEIVKQNQKDGETYGVSGTPAFFINGRMMSGAQPYEDFAKVIDEELERAGVKPPAAGQKVSESKS
jgi:protein-disulfide isomerase